MKTSAAGRAEIAAHEGVVLTAYRDVAGVWTIGVGHTARAGGLKPTPGMRITRERALAILAADLARFEGRVRATGAFPAQKPFDGAVSFDFNTGRIHNASWVRLYRTGDLRGAEASLMRWTRAGGKTWPGLVRRRKAEADLIFRGRYSHGGAAPLAAQAPGAPLPADEIRSCQARLKALGFYSGTVDGRNGAETRAAVRAFQRSHPHLDDDGIVGPATRAALTRAMALRKRILQAAAASAGTGAAAAAVERVVPSGTAAGGLDGPVLGVAAGLIVLAVLAGVLAWRYRDEIRHLAGKL